MIAAVSTLAESRAYPSSQLASGHDGPRLDYAIEIKREFTEDGRYSMPLGGYRSGPAAAGIVSAGASRTNQRGGCRSRRLEL